MLGNIIIPPMFDINTSISMDRNRTLMVLDEDLRTKLTSIAYMFCLGLRMECSLYMH